MSQRLASRDGSALATHLGVRWIDGAWSNVWSDGVVLPILSGGAPEDDDDTGNEDENDDDENEDEDDDDDDEGEDDKDKGKKKKLSESERQRLSREAAKYRTQRNTAREARDEARAKITTLEAKVSDLQKKVDAGGSDDSLKERVAELEKTLSEREAELDKERKTNRSTSIDRQVSSAVSDLKIKEDADMVRYLLEKNEMLEVDDESGDIEDLEKSLKRLIKRGKLTVVSDEDDDDDDDEDDKPSSSGRSRSKSRDKSKNGLDRESLTKKFPALRR